MSRRGILAVSLCLNLVLLAVAIFAFRRPAAPAVYSLPAESASAPASPAAPGHVTNSVVITNRFHWSQLESPNYERYLANLRGIGCPEKTIRDILVRDIEKTFALRMAKRPDPVGFWACGPERESAEAARRKEIANSREEMRELTRRLLGVDYVKGSSDFDDLAGQAILMFIAGTTREGAVEKVMNTFKRAEAVRDEIREASEGVITPGYEVELARNREQTLAQLRDALSPGELEEFGLRFSAIKFMEGDLDDFKCSPAELRAMAAAYYQTVGFSGLNFELFDNEPDMPPAKEDELLARMKIALGDRRFEDFLRDTDSDFNALSGFVSEANLPGNMALALFDVRRLAERERSQLLADASVSGPARHARLEEIRRATLDAVRAQLGDPAYQDYAGRGMGTWIEELGRP